MIRLQEAGLGEWNAREQAFEVPAPEIAGLSGPELTGLGLPSPMPFSMEIESEGAPADEAYRIRYSFFDPATGRTLIAPRRTGALLEVGDRRYIVPNPYFGVVEAADGLSRPGTRDRRKHLEALAQFQESLPNSVAQGPHLRSIRLVRAAGLELQPFLNSSGEPDFDPVLLSGAAAESQDLGGLPGRRALLPEAVQKQWARLSRKRREAHELSPAGDGWIVIAPEPVRRVLGELRRIQAAPVETRRQFLRDPQATLKAALEGAVPEELIDSIFVEGKDFSQRVREVGIWEPRTLPFLRSSGRDWLPASEAGLMVGDVEVPIPQESLEEAEAQVARAIEQGISEVVVEGVRIPANQQSLDAIRTLRERAGKPLREAVEAARGQKLALLILDNLESLEYQPPDSAEQVQDPSDLNLLETKPLPHQVQGFNWLQGLWMAGRGGALLADDMGLGKTLQTLAFLAWLQRRWEAERREKLPILVVGPTGLLRNWRAEHDRHLKGNGLGEFLEAQGAGLRDLRRPNAHRGVETGAGLPVLDPQRLRNADWVLTTYETLRDYQHSFGRVRWLAIVFDEAQRFKNPQTLVTQAVKAMNAAFSIALTGTPVENRLSDLWCIVDAVQPGTLGSLKDFCDRYEPSQGYLEERLTELKQKLTASGHPVMLRRMKEDHLEGLPQIEVHSSRRTMPPQQAAAYTAAVRGARASAEAGGMLAALHALRSTSLHPASDLEMGDDAYIAGSARWAYAFEVLEEVRRNREKALVFLDSLVHQGHLAELLQRRFGLASAPLIINGSVAGSLRLGRVQEFESRRGFDVMILSPRAGGVGLTLTEANHVIHLSRWWNPAVEDQCTDRVYRIGQKRTVHVHLPLAIHPEYGDQSFDARLEQLLSEKRRLSRSVLAPPATDEQDIKKLYEDTVSV